MMPRFLQRATMVLVCLAMSGFLRADEPVDPFAVSGPPPADESPAIAPQDAEPAGSAPAVAFPTPGIMQFPGPSPAVAAENPPAANVAPAAEPARPADDAAVQASEAERLENQARDRELEAALLRERAARLRNGAPAAADLPPRTARSRHPGSGISFRYAGRAFSSFDEFRGSPEWRMMKFELEKRKQRRLEERTAAADARREAVQFQRRWRNMSPAARHFAGTGIPNVW